MLYSVSTCSACQYLFEVNINAFYPKKLSSFIAFMKKTVLLPKKPMLQHIFH